MFGVTREGGSLRTGTHQTLAVGLVGQASSPLHISDAVGGTVIILVPLR